MLKRGDEICKIHRHMPRVLDRLHTFNATFEFAPLKSLTFSISLAIYQIGNAMQSKHEIPAAFISFSLVSLGSVLLLSEINISDLDILKTESVLFSCFIMYYSP